MVPSARSSFTRMPIFSLFPGKNPFKMSAPRKDVIGKFSAPLIKNISLGTFLVVYKSRLSRFLLKIFLLGLSSHKWEIRRPPGPLVQSTTFQQLKNDRSQNLWMKGTDGQDSIFTPYRSSSPREGTFSRIGMASRAGPTAHGRTFSPAGWAPGCQEQKKG